MNFENILELIVDDEELLMIPPFISGSVSVLNTTEQGSDHPDENVQSDAHKKAL